MSAADPVAPVDAPAEVPNPPQTRDCGAAKPGSAASRPAGTGVPESSPAPASSNVSLPPENSEASGDTALGMSRGDRLFAGILGVVILILLLVHWARLSGWGARTVEIARQSPQTFQFHLDINSANWVELSQLDGLGEALARRIVEEREQKGPFRSVDDLRRVKGIGPKTLDKLRPWIRAEPPKSDSNGHVVP